MIKAIPSPVLLATGACETLKSFVVCTGGKTFIDAAVQLTGKVYNETGKEIERQTIWVGNTLSPKILRGMTLEDIPQLQDLKPLKNFEIPPGDSIPFTIVFLKSAKSAKEFTCAVSTATGES